MKVILIYPPSPFLIEQKNFSPLGILYVASNLEKMGIDIQVVDLSNRENFIEQDVKYLSASLFGISATTPQYPSAKKILTTLKRVNTGAKVVIGGAHSSTVPRECIRDGFDYAVIGEGDNAIPYIIDALQSKKEIEKIIKMPYIKDIDEISPPARHLINLKSYGYKIDSEKATTLITSRGCPFNCAFCSKDVWEDSGVRFHSPAYILEEVKGIIDNYGFRDFLFLDDVLTLDTKRLFKICDILKPLNIKFRAYVRSDMTKDMLIAMKEAGCIEVGVGVESGSQKILNNVNKKVTVEENTRFVKLCKEIGLCVNVFLMIGLPGETYKTVMETKRWMEEVRPDKFGFNIFAPYKGTPIYNNSSLYDIKIFDMPDEQSWVKGRMDEYQCFVETAALKREEILGLFKELFSYFTDLTGWKPGIGSTNV
jgi:radical SAM superfamily enzyme YgiQ (UPF0313 family)